MAEIAITAFVTLFVVIDPLGNLPVFVALTSGESIAHKRRMAFRGVSIAAMVLMLFALSGAWILEVLGIGLPAFRIAGGLFLMVIAFEMVFEKRNPRRQHTAEEIAAAPTPSDISVFPLAIPLTAGPGAITSLLLLLGRYSPDRTSQSIVLGMLCGVLLIQFLLFLGANLIDRVLGPTINSIISRLLGILLAALAVQYLLDGIREGLLS